MSQPSLKADSSIRADLIALVGEQGLLEGAAVRERGAALFHGRVESELLVRPRSTEQVSAILKLCHARGQPVVTHGGLTGLVQGRRRRPRRYRSVTRGDECHRARRCLGALFAGTGRCQARQRATRGRGTRHGISARSRRARQRHGRWQHLDQCGRPARSALRNDAQPGAGHRSRACRWHGAHLAEPHAQEQCRLRPQAIVHRQRGHARRRDARRAAPGLAHPQPGDAAGVAAELRRHGGIVRPPGLRTGWAAGGLRGAVGQLLRLQHHARRG